MQVNEHLFVIANEEALELARAFARCNRFGLDSMHPTKEISASKEVVAQMNDLLAAIELMKDRGIVFEGFGEPTALGECKKRLVEEMEMSLSAGLLEMPADESEETETPVEDDVEAEVDDESEDTPDEPVDNITDSPIGEVVEDEDEDENIEDEDEVDVEDEDEDEDLEDEDEV